MSPPRDDARYYERAAAEIEDGEHDRGLWEKCLSQSSGAEKDARELYVRRRVSQLHTERGEQAVELAKSAARDAAARNARARQERFRRVEGRNLDREDDRRRWLRALLFTGLLAWATFAALRWHVDLGALF